MDLVMIFKAVILGIVEGITEFLPISSTGHMIIADQFVHLSSNKAFTDAFEVIIQLGAILSVCVYFFKDLWPFKKDKEERNKKFALWAKVLVAVIPAILIGAVYSKLHLKEKLFNPAVVAGTLLVYGVVIILIENFHKNKNDFKVNTIKDLTFKSVLLIGLFQCLAMVPGTSRSAATIIGAMLIGFSRPMAAEFSFFLAIPTMIAASGKDLMDFGFTFTSSELQALAAGFITSFIVAFAVIKFFMNFIKNKDFKIFGYYRIVLGVVVIFLIAVGIL